MRYKRRLRVFIPFIILAAVALLGLIVMQLWNYVLPRATGVRPLSYLQATGLLLLCKILFGSIRPPGAGFRHRPGPWRDKLMNMSEEDRAKFKAEWRARRFGTKQPPAEKGSGFQS